MKKLLPVILSLLAILMFIGLGAILGGSPAEKPFLKELCAGITEVHYIDYYGNETVYTDKKSINLMADALRSGIYKEIDAAEIPAGPLGHSFTFISNGKEYKTGYNENIVGYNGHSYRVYFGKWHKLSSLTK